MALVSSLELETDPHFKNHFFNLQIHSGYHFSLLTPDYKTCPEIMECLSVYTSCSCGNDAGFSLIMMF